MSEATAEPPVPDAVFGFNPFDPEFRKDPYPVYRRLRAEAPVFRSPFGVWVLSRYADILAVIQDPRGSNDQRNTAGYEAFVERRRAAGVDVEEAERRRGFLFLDPPDHTRLRGLVSKAFTPRVVESLRPRIQEVTDRLIDAKAAAGSMDVIEDLAYPLPVTIISEMLGVPPEDQSTFRQWSRELAQALDPEMAVPPEVLERRRGAAEEFVAYFQQLIAERRRSSRDDLLSALIAAEEKGDKLSEDELLGTCILLLIAGHETTVSLIGNGVLALLRNPDELDKLRGDPSLAKSAVEEVLRYDPPVQMIVRFSRDDMNVDGDTIPKGQGVLLLIGSANRDPEQFPDPDRFDIARERNHHIAFSAGIHFCLGASLARLEGQIALSALVRRLPEMKLATEIPEYKENIILRGLASLPVAF